MKVDIEIRGAAELKNAMIKKAAFGVAKKMMRYHVAEIQKEAQRLVRVDTGHLKRSISTDISTQEDDIVGVVRAGADYAGYQEKGTRFMAAKPYLKPAYNKQKPQFLRDLKRLQREK